MPKCQVYFKVKPGILVMMENVRNNKLNTFFKATFMKIILNFMKNFKNFQNWNSENEIEFLD